MNTLATIAVLGWALVALNNLGDSYRFLGEQRPLGLILSIASMMTALAVCALVLIGAY